MEEESKPNDEPFSYQRTILLIFHIVSVQIM